MLGFVKTAALAGSAYAAYKLPRSDIFTQYYQGVHGDREQTSEVIANLQRLGSVSSVAMLGVGAYRMMGKGFNRKHGKPSKRRPPAGAMDKMYAGVPGGASAAAIGRFAGRHPYLTTAGLAGAGGFLANAGFGVLDRRGIVGEGRITAIHSSRAGGMDPSLNLSTQGLVQSLHNQQRRF